MIRNVCWTQKWCYFTITLYFGKNCFSRDREVQKRISPKLIFPLKRAFFAHFLAHFPHFCAFLRIFSGPPSAFFPGPWQWNESTLTLLPKPAYSIQQLLVFRLSCIRVIPATNHIDIFAGNHWVLFSPGQSALGLFYLCTAGSLCRIHPMWKACWCHLSATLTARGRPSSPWVPGPRVIFFGGGGHKAYKKESEEGTQLISIT